MIAIALLVYGMRLIVLGGVSGGGGGGGGGRRQTMTPANRISDCDTTATA
jgi:hypothetical protein